MKPILNLTIRRKWLDMIASGQKREEYRDPRNAQVGNVYARCVREPWLPLPLLVLRAGYTMQSPALAVEVVGMTLRGPREVLHPKWGEGELRGIARFVLSLGDVLARGDYAAVRAWMEARK